MFNKKSIHLKKSKDLMRNIYLIKIVVLSSMQSHNNMLLVK